MGWGVNDNETFPFLLEKNIKKKVYNLGVSSYGTIREIKKMILSGYFKNSKTIIIQYHPNDIFENAGLEYNKIYAKKEYDEIYESKAYQLNSIKFILKNYKTSIRLFFSDIIDILFREKNIEKINFNEHKEYLEDVINEKIDLSNKELIVLLVLPP